MLYKDEYRSGNETVYIHICDDAHRYQKKYIAERPRIYVHDIGVRMNVNGVFLDIEYCPYCGKKIDDEHETATNESYKF